MKLIWEDPNLRLICICSFFFFSFYTSECFQLNSEMKTNEKKSEIESPTYQVRLSDMQRLQKDSFLNSKETLLVAIINLWQDMGLN